MSAPPRYYEACSPLPQLVPLFLGAALRGPDWHVVSCPPLCENECKWLVTAVDLTGLVLGVMLLRAEDPPTSGVKGRYQHMRGVYSPLWQKSVNPTLPDCSRFLMVLVGEADPANLGKTLQWPELFGFCGCRQRAVELHYYGTISKTFLLWQGKIRGNG